MWKFVAWSFLPALMLVSAVWAGDDAMVQSVAVGSAPTLVVDVSGDTRIVKSADGQIRATGVLKPLEAAGGPAGGAFRLRSEPTGARIDTDYSTRRYKLELTIEVPAATTVVIDDLEGSLTIEGLDGKTQGKYKSGLVRIVDHGGDVELRCKEGQIDVELKRTGTQRVWIEVKRGQVAANVSAAKTGSGLIKVNEGSIDLRVAPEAQLTLESRVTEKGRVVVDKPITQPDPMALFFTTRGGGPPWTLQVEKGEIRVAAPTAAKKKQP